MSDAQNDESKKSESGAQQDSGQSDSGSEDQGEQQKKQQQQPVKRAAPRIGTPIGTPPTSTTSNAAPQQQPPSSTTPATPAAPQRPRIGTPIGTPAGSQPVAPGSTSGASPNTSAPPPAPATGAKRPTIGTPVGSKPTVGTSPTPPQASTTPPTPAASRPVVSSPVARPSIAAPGGPRPATPAKKVESKEEVSRRNFIRGLAVLGGIVAIVQFGGLGPYLQSSVGASSSPASSQVIEDSTTGNQITPATFNSPTRPDWVPFVYPRTGNANIDNDTFRQWVIIRLPSGFTAPPGLSTKDSSGNLYVGFSRVCVHLWCLWSYVPTDMRMECPCHGSQYVPGSGTYPLLPAADNQPPGRAVEGPASLQTSPNNELPIIIVKYNSNGTFSAGPTIIGQVGCGQLC